MGTNANLLGVCIMHQTAFPHGPEHADLSQTLCNLISENMGNQLSCDGHTTMTGSEFQEVYEASHAEFCLQNAVLVASVVAGTNPDTQLVYETALAETLFYLQATGEQDGSNDARRKLGFWDDVGDGLSTVGNEIENGFDTGFQALNTLHPALRAVILLGGSIMLFGMVITSALLLGYLFIGRRALTASAGINMIALNANDILTECVHGVDSFLCELPVSQLLQLFSTGVCASVAGLVCVVTSDDLLALGGNY